MRVEGGGGVDGRRALVDGESGRWGVGSRANPGGVLAWTRNGVSPGTLRCVDACAPCVEGNGATPGCWGRATAKTDAWRPGESSRRRCFFGDRPGGSAASNKEAAAATNYSSAEGGVGGWAVPTVAAAGRTGRLLRLGLAHTLRQVVALRLAHRPSPVKTRPRQGKMEHAFAGCY